MSSTLRQSDLKPATNESISDKHISLSEKLSSYIRGLINLIKIFLQYRRTYVNYLTIFKGIAQKKYPLKAMLRNSNHIVLNSFFQSYRLARLQDQKRVKYDIMNDVVSILDLSYVADSKASLRLFGGLSNGEVVNIFVDNVYRVLPVEGMIVIDVGANIADSGIYFALRNANRVIGVEPFPKNYELAKKNIEVNNLSNKITMVLAGCAANRGYINVDSRLESGIANQIDGDFKRGARVPLLTLEYLLKEYKIQRGEAVLKMDCEGCEYDVILSAKDEILTSFNDILIEYHYGHKDLKERLEKCGFEVSLMKLSGRLGGTTAVPDPEKIGRWYYMGYIYAKKKRNTK
jgi:FkbM family methyltransferase